MCALVYIRYVRPCFCLCTKQSENEKKKYRLFNRNCTVVRNEANSRRWMGIELQRDETWRAYKFIFSWTILLFIRPFPSSSNKKLSWSISSILCNVHVQLGVCVCACGFFVSISILFVPFPSHSSSLLRYFFFLHFNYFRNLNLNTCSCMSCPQMIL